MTKTIKTADSSKEISPRPCDYYNCCFCMSPCPPHYIITKEALRNMKQNSVVTILRNNWKVVDKNQGDYSKDNHYLVSEGTCNEQERKRPAAAPQTPHCTKKDKRKESNYKIQENATKEVDNQDYFKKFLTSNKKTLKNTPRYCSGTEKNTKKQKVPILLDGSKHVCPGKNSNIYNPYFDNFYNNYNIEYRTGGFNNCKIPKIFEFSKVHDGANKLPSMKHKKQYKKDQTIDETKNNENGNKLSETRAPFDPIWHNVNDYKYADKHDCLDKDAYIIERGNFYNYYNVDYKTLWQTNYSDNRQE